MPGQSFFYYRIGILQIRHSISHHLIIAFGIGVDINAVQSPRMCCFPSDYFIGNFFGAEMFPNLVNNVFPAGFINCIETNGLLNTRVKVYQSYYWPIRRNLKFIASMQVIIERIEYFALS